MKKLILIFLIGVNISLLAQKTTPQDYINKYATTAQTEMKRSGVPAAITLAQAILESESGNGELAQKSNNHFGIKCKETWQGEKVYHNDDARGECFRKYNDVLQSYSDHSDFLKVNGRYTFLFDLDINDYKGWAKGLKKAGYATNPSYAQLLITIIEKYDLAAYNTAEYHPVIDEVSATVKANIAVVAKEPASDIIEQQDLNKIYYINETKAVRAVAGTSLLLIADKYNISLSKLLDFNDFKNVDKDILTDDSYVFIQRKRKQGAMDTHIIRANETIYDIAQEEGIRLISLLEYNNITASNKLVIGEILMLKKNK
jgi:LysM repeat protein